MRVNWRPNEGQSSKGSVGNGIEDQKRKINLRYGRNLHKDKTVSCLFEAQNIGGGLGKGRHRLCKTVMKDRCVTVAEVRKET